MEMNPSGFVYVPVPIWLLAQVLAFIAARMSAVLPTPPTPPPSPPVPGLPETAQPATIMIAGIPWLVSDLERAVRESVYPLLSAWDLLARRTSDWVSQDEVCSATGQTPPQLRGTWGQLTKRCNSKYGHSDWPFESKRLEGQFHFRMSEDVAEIVRRVRADMPS